MTETLDQELDAAFSHFHQGRLDLAEESLRRVLAQEPHEPDALNLLGLLLQNQGRLEESIEVLNRAVHHAPDFPEAHANLARALRAFGRPDEAFGAAHMARTLSPTLGEAHLQLGAALLDLHRDREAVEALKAACEAFEPLGEIHTYLGTAYLRLREVDAAITELSKAVSVSPERVDAHVNLGAALIEAGRPSDAIPLLQRAIELAPLDPSAFGGLAVALQQTGRVTEAIMVCGEALSLAADRNDLWLQQGTNYAALGRFDEAESCFKRVLDRCPDDVTALAQLTLIHRVPDDLHALGALKAGLANPAAAIKERIAAGFALGARLDRIGRYDDAFAAYRQANELALSTKGHARTTEQLTSLKATVDWAIATFTPALFSALAGLGSSSAGLTFIVGMPRSGTTLVEQIAASHPLVFGAGESKDVGTLVALLDGGRTPLSPLMWDRGKIGVLADAHAARILALKPEARVIIDKLPDNLQILGQIAVLFPRSRIILCRRDPRDVALSCYFQNFSDNAEWSNDLRHCVDRCEQTERLVKLWRSVLPLPILEVEYGRLVADLEAEARRLIAFLGLEWNPACLTFHGTERPVMTASRWQVRQPLYDTSVERWKNYAQHLAPFLPRLERLASGQGPDENPWPAAHDQALLDENTCRKNLAAAPQDAVLWHRLGTIMLEQGKVDEAEAALQQALMLKPDFAAVQADMAQVMRAQGKVAEAEAALRQALALQPNFTFAEFLLGCIRQEAGCLEEAEAIFTALCAHSPASVEVWVRLAGLRSDLQRYAEAAEALSHVIEANRANYRALSNMGWLLAKCGRHTEALPYFQQAASLAPEDSIVQYQLGVAYWEERNAEAAVQACQAALRIDSGFKDALALLGRALSILGRFAEAAIALRKSLEIDPQQPELWHALTMIGQADGSSEEADTLRAVLASSNNALSERAAAGFTLFRILEKSANLSAAFAALETANHFALQACREHGRTFDHSQLCAYVDLVISEFTASRLASFRQFGLQDRRPVFVVGVPRSGTSLVEQIIASHPNAHGAGELGIISDIAEARFVNESQILAWDSVSSRQLADQYLEALCSRSGQAVRVVDKAPVNLMHLGHVAALFPNARVVICRRDARDTCFSCYSQYFINDLTWSFDQKSCASYAVEMDRLVRHWRDVLPLPMLEVQYEDMIRDQEQVSRRLIDFLDLNWNDACLQFHKTERSVFTASHWQVKQPIYDSSVGRWRRYREWLGPMLTILSAIQPESTL